MPAMTVFISKVRFRLQDQVTDAGGRYQILANHHADEGHADRQGCRLEKTQLIAEGM